MNLAPIILFVYNRPEHTKSTVKALQENSFAKDSLLFIYSDAPKSKKEEKKVKQTRKFINNISGFKAVKVIERKENLGLAKSIIIGVTEIIDNYGSAIVLEDDIQTEPGFLGYMNSALEFYKSNKQIFSISGYVYPYKKIDEYEYDTFVYPRASTWGWATWKEKWKNADWDIKDFSDYLTNDLKKQEFCRGGADLDQMLRMQMDGKINSWGIRWCYSQYKNHAFTIFPVKSLVQNIGLDGTGEHCGAIEHFNVQTDKKIKEWKFVDTLEENLEISNSVRQFFEPNITTIAKHRNVIKNSVKRLLLKRNRIIEKLRKDRDLEKIKRLMIKIGRFKPAVLKFHDLQLFTNDVPSVYFQLKQIWQDEIYSFSNKSSKSVIIDCGANIGISSIYFSKKYPESKIVSYEADPDVFKLFERNLQINNIQNVEAINSAIWIDNKGISFNPDSADGGSIDTTDNSKQKVNSVRLKEEIVKYDEISMLKIDIEGAETNVLVDCSKNLSNISNIFIEYHSETKKRQSLDRILNILTENNFRFYIENEKLRKQPFKNRLYCDAMDMQVNIWAYKIP